MSRYDLGKVRDAVTRVLRESLGLSLTGVMKSFPKDAESEVWDALQCGVKNGSFCYYMSDDDPPVQVYTFRTADSS